MHYLLLETTKVLSMAASHNDVAGSALSLIHIVLGEVFIVEPLFQNSLVRKVIEYRC